MTNIDFYILQDSAITAREQFACRLVEKAIQSNHRVFIALDDSDQAQNFSNHLWSFKPESFAAHVTQEDNQGDSQVLLAWQADDESHHDVMINLQSRVPDHFSRFQQLMEVVVQDELILSATRANFQFYRHRGYPLKWHKIGNR